ncbi:MAG: MaoC family dehydratase N-terminal domain-containing protein [Propionibacteriaceae bacterium]|jgi:acyl dehydratase|nr:MaoC family dehydratase N-terminal domain-containing protein [Propionibacteriaceae bacterium]
MTRPIDLSWQLFWEDIPVGYTATCLARTIQHADIINFANYTRDYQQIHVDREFAKSSLYGDVIMHGLMGVSIASGMLLRTEFGTRTLRTMLKCLGYKTIKFPAPIQVDDTVTTTFEVIDKSDFDETKGLLEIRLDAVNQRGVLVSTHQRTYLFAKKNFDFETIAERGSF